MSDVFDEVCQEQGWGLAGDRATVELAGGRKQDLFRERTTEDGEEILRLYTVVGDASVLDQQRMSAALSLNYRLRYGAIAIRGGALVLTDTLLLREADRDEVRLSAEYLAKTADSHEKLIFGTDEH